MEGVDVTTGGYYKVGPMPGQDLPYKDIFTDDLYMKDMTLEELKLLSDSLYTGSTIPIVQAMDNLLSVDVNKITIPDFNFLLLKQKVKALPDLQSNVIKWKCTNMTYINPETKEMWMEKYENLVEFGEPVLDKNGRNVKVPVKVPPEYKEFGPCNTENTMLAQFENYELTTLDADLPPLPEGFDFPRVGILEEYTTAKATPEYAFLADGISWIAGDTWEEKIQKAQNNPNMVILGNQLKEKYKFGINYFVTLFCNKCGVISYIPYELKIQDFFQ